MQKHFSGFQKNLCSWFLALFLVLLTCTGAAAALINLTWDPNDQPPDAYQLFQRTEGGAYNYASPVWSGSTTSCTINNLQDSTTYYFVLRARQGDLQSGDSNEITFRSDPPPVTYALTATAGANGQISPSGQTIVTAGASQTYTITPAANYHISNVLVDGQSVGAVSSYTFNSVNANHSISASFAINTYIISSAAGSNGTIQPSGNVQVSHGSSQGFTITPTAGYHVTDVRVNGVSVGATTSYTFPSVTSNGSISAYFALNTHTITASAGANGTVSPAGAVSVNHNGTQTFTMAAAAGYELLDVKIDGQSQGPLATYTFTQVTGNHTIAASFAPKTYIISAQAGQGGTISPTGQIPVSHGGSQSFTIAAGNGYELDALLIDGSPAAKSGTYNFSNVTAAHQIEARFKAANQAPSANAGPDQNVRQGESVWLSGMGSTDPDGGIVSYAWRQIQGPAVALSSPTQAETGFTAPQVAQQGAALTFELRVRDASGAESTDTCIVNVAWVNAPPTAQAGSDQTVNEGSQVVLDGSSSVDPDAGNLTYQWVQTAGPAVALSGAATANPAFTAPDVAQQGASLTFQLTVTDAGGLKDTDTCTITVAWVGMTPVADAGPDQQVIEGTEGRLNGANSTDPDNGIASFLWAQTDGPPVVLSDPTAVNPSFTAPDVGPQGAALTFRLTVTDAGGLRNDDSCIVNILWENLPPEADAGDDQTVGEGAMVQLDGSGSTDADDGLAAYQWTQTSGPAVVISNAAAAVPTFTAPDVDPAGAALVFKLTVLDASGLKSEDSCTVNVTWQNQPPAADAGLDQDVSADAEVTLDGSGSMDVDDGIVSYRWKQINGSPVTLLDPQADITTFTAPALEADSLLTFELTVTDLGGLQNTAACQVYVRSAPGDTTPPAIEILQPAGGLIFNFKTSINVSGTASDDRGIDRIEWVSDRGFSGVAQGTTQWRIDNLRLRRWMNTITITAYDKAGNSTSATLQIMAVIVR